MLLHCAIHLLIICGGKKELKEPEPLEIVIGNKIIGKSRSWSGGCWFKCGW